MGNRIHLLVVLLFLLASCAPAVPPAPTPEEIPLDIVRGVYHVVSGKAFSSAYFNQATGEYAIVWRRNAVQYAAAIFDGRMQTLSWDGILLKAGMEPRDVAVFRDALKSAGFGQISSERLPQPFHDLAKDAPSILWRAITDLPKGLTTIYIIPAELLEEPWNPETRQQ